MTPQLWSLILTSALLHAIWNFGAKKVSGNIQVFWLATGVASLLSAPWAVTFALTHSVSPESWVRMLISGLFTSAYTLVLARAYRTGDLSFVYPIARGCGVAGAAVSGKYFLGESISRAGGFGILAVCLGTVVMSFHRDHRQESARMDLLLALFTGLILAVSAVNDKQAMGGTSPGLYVCAEYFLTAVLLAPFLLPGYLRMRRGNATEATRLLGYGVLVGAGSVVSYGLVLMAYQLGPMSYIIPAREFAVVLASGLGVIWLREPMTLKKGLGIASITIGLVLIKLA